MANSRGAEVWGPYDLGIDVSGTAWDIQVIDAGTPLRVIVVLEPTNHRYCLSFEQMTLVGYLVSSTNRVNHVQCQGTNDRGGIYLVKNSDFHRHESRWEGDYTAETTLHLAIPAVSVTAEILAVQAPTVTRLDDAIPSDSFYLPPNPEKV